MFVYLVVWMHSINNIQSTNDQQQSAIIIIHA